jgi:hypothetical protein
MKSPFSDDASPISSPGVTHIVGFGGKLAEVELEEIEALQMLGQSDLLQGRAFALASMVAQATMPVGLLLTGMLADKVFEPMFQPGGLLAANLGGIISVGPGREIGLMLVLMGVVIVLGVIAGYLYPRL